MSGSRVIRRGDRGWEGIEPRVYKERSGRHDGVVRHEILSAGSAEGLAFDTRCFEVAPGGYTSLERHGHAHLVIVLNGRGSVRLGDRTEPLGPLDAVYVAPWETHRFHADADEPLGFLCVVDHARDRPQEVEEPEGGA